MKKPQSVTYRALTRDIRVSVTPRYLAERSDPSEGQYLFGYTIEIANLGLEAVQLLTRRWLVTDARGGVQEVEGEGVVGEQPVLEPGQAFEYTSGVPLTTPSGMMVGSFGMTTRAGTRFDVEVPAFSLDADGAPRVLN